jgi:hypothetical protein
MKPPTIRVGQRLIRWDGVRGYVALNSTGTRVHAAGEAFLVEWADGEREYLTLEQCETEGVTRGKGVMPWARSHAHAPDGARRGTGTMPHAHTPEYQMGYARAQSAVARTGKDNLSPSMVDKDEYSSLWAQFLAGWKAGLSAAAHEDCAS